MCPPQPDPGEPLQLVGGEDSFRPRAIKSATRPGSDSACATVPWAAFGDPPPRPPAVARAALRAAPASTPVPGPDAKYTVGGAEIVATNTTRSRAATPRAVKRRGGGE